MNQTSATEQEGQPASEEQTLCSLRTAVVMEAECSTPRSDSGRGVSSYELFMFMFLCWNCPLPSTGRKQGFHLKGFRELKQCCTTLTGGKQDVEGL